MDERTVLRGDHVTLKSARAEDLDLLATWFADPAFAISCGGPPKTRDEVAKKYLSDDPSPVGFIVEARGSQIGYIQGWSHEPPDGGIDVILRPEGQGQGFGADAVRVLANHLRTLGWRHITVDPTADNHRAIRAFEKAGFVKERSTGDFIIMAFTGLTSKR